MLNVKINVKIINNKYWQSEEMIILKNINSTQIVTLFQLNYLS